MNVPTEEAADLTKEATVDVLAWVVRHFVPFLSSNTCAFFESMVNGVPLPHYICHSDLAFAVLVLEHHIMKWRHLIQFELETGRPVPLEYSRQAKGLLYKDGIAGEEGKRRFDDLNVYFFNRFYSPACPERLKNVTLLQGLVDRRAKADIQEINATWQRSSGWDDAVVQELQNDILHRVFYSLYM